MFFPHSKKAFLFGLCFFFQWSSTEFIVILVLTVFYIFLTAIKYLPFRSRRLSNYGKLHKTIFYMMFVWIFKWKFQINSGGFESFHERKYCGVCAAEYWRIFIFENQKHRTLNEKSAFESSFRDVWILRCLWNCVAKAILYFWIFFDVFIFGSC